MKQPKKPESEVAVPMTIRLPRSGIERLESAATGQGMTRSKYARILLLELRPPKPLKAQSSPRERMVSIKILSELNTAGRRIESAVRILERAADGGHLDNDTVDRAAVEIASVDSTLREALKHASKN